MGDDYEYVFTEWFKLNESKFAYIDCGFKQCRDTYLNMKKIRHVSDIENQAVKRLQDMEKIRFSDVKIGVCGLCNSEQKLLPNGSSYACIDCNRRHNMVCHKTLCSTCGYNKNHETECLWCVKYEKFLPHNEK